MREIEFSADELVSALLNLSKTETICLLDSGGVFNLESHLLIGGIRPVEALEISNESAEKTLRLIDEKFADEKLANIFTISYDFGLKLQNINARSDKIEDFDEPDVFLASFDCLVVHDYHTTQTFLTGNEKRFDEIERLLNENVGAFETIQIERSIVSSNFTREKYIETIEKIQEFIRRGDTYQTNLTQQFSADLPETLSPQQIFNRLRNQNPTAFSAFVKRQNDCVVSASPERFFKIQKPKNENQNLIVSASPIKGTRPRGKDETEDLNLRNELLNSSKDRAENVMIVDLLRNDLGRICEFGTVKVEKLCDLETHPTLFHLVSTINGELRENVKFSEILKAVFPCGSITGAPKIRTMQIIEDLETVSRGLSMGAVGFRISDFGFRISNAQIGFLDLSVAIRTMVVKNQKAVFNVGGGITIDSVPAEEYEETLVKARALLNAINGKLI